MLWMESLELLALLELCQVLNVGGIASCDEFWKKNVLELGELRRQKNRNGSSHMIDDVIGNAKRDRKNEE